MAENRIDPLEHYASSGSDEGRLANAVFQSFESGAALAVSSEIEGEDFAIFKDTAFSVIETRELDTEVSGFPLVIAPFVWKSIKIIGIALIGKEIYESADNIQQLLEGSEGNIYWTPVDDGLLDEGNVEKFPRGNSDVPTSTPPFDVGELTGFEDIFFFPKGDIFLNDILDGRYEFPDEGEAGSYFLAIDETITSYRTHSRKGV